MGKDFNEALGNFVLDFSSRGAINHLTDLGHTIDEIDKELDYPISIEKIAEIVFQHYIETGKVCLSQPDKQVEKVKYVKEQNSFGKISMRKVIEKVEINAAEYEICDYGKQLYKNKCVKDESIKSGRMLSHINKLPWPIENVWIRKDLFID